MFCSLYPTKMNPALRTTIPVVVIRCRITFWGILIISSILLKSLLEDSETPQPFFVGSPKSSPRNAQNRTIQYKNYKYNRFAHICVHVDHCVSNYQCMRIPVCANAVRYCAALSCVHKKRNEGWRSGPNQSFCVGVPGLTIWDHDQVQGGLLGCFKIIIVMCVISA